MRLLILAPFPYSAASGEGGATACSNALAELAADHEIAVLCFCDGSAAHTQAAAQMERKAVRVRTVRLRLGKAQLLRAKVVGLLTRTPEHACYFQSAEFGAALQQLMAEFKPDLAICQFPQMAQYLSHLKDTPSIQDVQDAFCVSWYRRAMLSPPGWRRWYAFKQWRNWISYESRHYPVAAQCWTLSEQDRFGLTVFMPQLNAVAVGVPLIDGTGDFPSASAPPTTVGFIGSFSHQPNVEALAFLLLHIVPALHRRHPNLQVIVAGRNPPPALVAGATPQIRFLGFVETLDQFYGQCTVVAAPLLSGGGIKIKVAEALCHGKAVVTTSIGAEGIPLLDGHNAFIANAPEGFSDRISRLLCDSALRQRIESEAHACARRTFGRAAWRTRVTTLLIELAQPSKGKE